MKPRFIFIHGNQSTNWAFAWTPWLKKELDQLGYETSFETFPDSIIARSEYWLPFLQDFLEAGENDVLVGWSTGAVAAMRYAENHRLKGSILVSPSYTDMGDELEKQSGYFDTPWQWQKIKDHQEKIALICDDDPYIPKEEFEFIAKQLQPTQIEVPGGKHFIEKTEFPELLSYIKANYL